MEIIALIIVSILSGCIGYLISSTRTHVKPEPKDVDKHRYEVVFDMQYYTLEEPKEAIVYMITERLAERLEKDFDKFIEQEEMKQGQNVRYTFEFYTKNK